MDLGDWDQMAKSESIVSLFSTLLYLDVIFSPSLMSTLRGLDSSSGKPNENNALNGMKLAAVSVLDGYCSSIVDSPWALGIELDPDYYDYGHFTKGRGRTVARGSTRKGHQISEIAETANALIFRILGTNSWEYTDPIREQVDRLVDSLRGIFLDCFHVTDARGHDVTAINALRRDAARHWDLEYTNVLKLSHVYTNYYHDPETKTPPSYDDVFSELQADQGSRFDRLELISQFRPIRIPDSWALGYAFVAHEVEKLGQSGTRLNGFRKLDVAVGGICNWAGYEHYVGLVDRLPTGARFLGIYTYSLQKPPSEEALRGLSTEPKDRRSPERLLSIVGNRARLINSGNSDAAYLNFMTLLDGAVVRSRRTGEPVRVAVFVHRLDAQREDYSVGVFMPAYSGTGFSNASRWWIFYLIGNNHSGTSSRQWGEVLRKIRRLKKRVVFFPVEAPEEEFLRYCEDPGYVRLETEIRVTDQMVSKIRGTYPELLISNLVANKGFRKIRLRVEPAFLRGIAGVKGDLDVVGVKVGTKRCQIVVFESKGGGITDRELEDELERFSKTLEVIAKDPARVCLECGISFHGQFSVKGYFVLMAHLPKEDQADQKSAPAISLYGRGRHITPPPNVVLWDLPTFERELRQCGTPEVYLDLLKEMPVATLIL